MSLQEAIALNAVAVVVAVMFGFFLGREGERWFSAGLVTSVALTLSFWGWVIFVASHFILKYW